MGESGGNFWMLHEKKGNLGTEKVEKRGFDWQQGCVCGVCGGAGLVKAPEGKWGEMGGNG